MTMKEQLRADLTTAMKARDELTSSTLRMVLTAVTNEEVAGKQARELTDDDVVTVLNREAKKRREASSSSSWGCVRMNSIALLHFSFMKAVSPSCF